MTGECPAKWPVGEGPAVSELYHGTPVIRHKMGMLRHYCHRNNRSTAILVRYECSESAACTEIPEFSPKNPIQRLVWVLGSSG